MLKIVLLNLPFAAYHLPSIGLTQLKSVLDAELGDEVETRIVYANLDFAAQLGLDLYERIGLSGDQLQSGFSEWFFRQVAFPDAPDNTEAYFARYYPAHDPGSQAFRRQVLEKRRMLDSLLDGLIDSYALDRADVVGCTSMFFENMVSFALARKIKARNPNVVTVLGGATSESPSGEEFVQQVKALDFVFSGIALKTFPRFARNLLDGHPERNHSINGVFSKLNQLAGAAGGPRVGPMGEELDVNTPIALDYGPFLDALEQKLPDWEVKAVLPFETSRGCWWGEHAHCTFCGLNKSTMGYRAMRPDLAVELIRSLFRYAGRAGVLMCVDNILQRQYVKEVFPYLDTPESLAIFYQLKANLTESEVAAMARARVKLITPGFESLSTETLKLMDKGVTAFHNLQVMKYCSLHDVHPGWNLLVGSPGEGEETYAKYLHDLPLFVHLPAPQGVFSIHFNRYSPYFTKAKEYNLDLHPLDYYEMVYPFPKEAIANIAYDFMDHNLDAEYLLALGKWIDRLQEKLRHWQERWRDHQIPPRLHLFERAGESWIYDSRSGEASEYPLSPAVRQLLLRLEEPRRLAVLAKETADVPGIDLPRDLAFLRRQGLVFEEGEKVMSLVLPRDVPPLTYRARALSANRKLRETRALEPALGPIARTARRAVVRPRAGA